jgi:formylglycine-generating enzyme required for sulfatase activity
MAVLFISHSSKDGAVTTALEAWLRTNGFTDVFVDYSIAGGDAWDEALKSAAGNCRVILCIVTESWLNSNECFGEFQAGFYMGKRIIPLFLLSGGHDRSDEAEKRLARVRAHYQGVDLAPCLAPGGALDLGADPRVAERLAAGLREAGALSRVGLDPEAFAIDLKLRPTPFPGLAAFGDHDADAALFYGRSREVAETLEALRRMRAGAERRPFVVFGASGAGKSSLLKAGIIPRLRREAPAWLPLRAFRPGSDPLLNFAEALARTLADFGKMEAHGVIRDRLFDGWHDANRVNGELTAQGRQGLVAALEAEGHGLRSAAGSDGATILVSVDQAEELARAEGSSGDALSDYLRAALDAPTSHWQLAFTIRSDSFPELQGHPRFQSLEARGYDLRVIPGYRFESVVEGPAKRYGVKVDQALVDAVMGDAPKEDALPLLAFALQRLWRQYAASGALTKGNYDKVGGLKGLIEDAAERALRGIGPEEDAALPSGPVAKRRLQLAASTFVPALAQINEQGAAIRRIATWNSFEDEQQELLTRFDQWRLVIRKGETAGGTVEAANEALFREWARLQAWLEPERVRLDALRSLQVDALTWDRNGRDASFLNHREKRLNEVSSLATLEGYRKRLGAVDLDYLAACREADKLRQRQLRRMWTFVGVLAVGLAGGAVAWINQRPLHEAYDWYTKVRPYMLTQVRPYVLAAQAERALKPSDTFRECAKDCPEMIVVPAGEFMMGSPGTEPGHRDKEAPYHKVAHALPFAVSKFPVTFAEWDACVAVTKCAEVVATGFGRGNKPAINMSWNEAKQYAAWLSEMTGKTYRLLTESQWEYVARAGAATAYFWGQEIGSGNANCSECGSAWDIRETSPVGSFKPNAFGLYDVTGNVWQWTEDCYHEDYAGAPSDGSAWSGGDCSARAVRSGGFWSTPRDVRLASRLRIPFDDHGNNLGFRLGRVLPAAR